MEVLRKDNQRLRNELFDITKQINSGKARTDLMAARNAILQDLDNNRESSRQVFEEGTLFQLATLGNDEYELAKQDIENNVFGFIQHEAKIKTGRPQFIKNSDGTYNIAVSVTIGLRYLIPTISLPGAPAYWKKKSSALKPLPVFPIGKYPCLLPALTFTAIILLVT